MARANAFSNLEKSYLGYKTPPVAGSTPERAREYPRELTELARLHEETRLECVAKILCFQSAISAHDWLKPPAKVADPRPIVAVRGATWQVGEKRPERVQAHCAPGQVFVWDIPLTHFVPPDYHLMHYALRGLFGRTDSMPEPFNRADTESERVLKPAFARASARVLDPAARPTTPGGVRRDVVRGAFAQYLAEAVAAHARTAEYFVRRLAEAPKRVAEFGMAIVAAEEYQAVAAAYVPERGDVLSDAGLRRFEELAAEP